MEVLVATMNRCNEQEIINLVEKMNIQTNAVVVNQNDIWQSEGVIYYRGNRIKYISVIDRGLSKSRNLALEHAQDEIIVIADDDITYSNNYFDIISQSYKKYPSATGIGFYVESTNLDREKKNTLKNGKLTKVETMKLSSYQLTFRLSQIKNMRFDENFGAGSIYTMGEENIFMMDLVKLKKYMYYSNEKIAVVSHTDSTWFKGYNEKYFFDKGASYKRMFGKLVIIMNLQFIIRKRSIFKRDVKLVSAFLYMLKGSKHYKLN